MTDSLKKALELEGFVLDGSRSGQLYIISSPTHFPSVIKLGSTQQETVEHRLANYNSSVPYPIWEIEYRTEKLIDVVACEKILHTTMAEKGFLPCYKKEWYPFEAIHFAVMAMRDLQRLYKGEVYDYQRSY